MNDLEMVRELRETADLLEGTKYGSRSEMLRQAATRLEDMYTAKVQIQPVQPNEEETLTLEPSAFEGTGEELEITHTEIDVEIPDFTDES